MQLWHGTWSPSQRARDRSILWLHRSSPTCEFWGYATGVGFVAAGVAILTGVQARLAAILLTAMVPPERFLRKNRLASL